VVCGDRLVSDGGGRQIVWAVSMAVLCSAGTACGGADQPTGSMEQRGDVKIVHLRGTPYQMGLQHGRLLYDQLVEGAAFIDDSSLWLMMDWAKDNGFVDDAIANSYPDVIEECRGMADGDEGMFTFEQCMTLAYGDVIVEFMNLPSLACSQFIVVDGATKDGRLLHGRNLDYDRMPFMEENPVLFVREPKGKIPYVVVGFPGNVSPYTGMNAAGLSVASNEANAVDDIDRTGRSHVQMVREILHDGRSLEDAESFIEAQDHMTAEIIVVADGNAHKGAVFEMTANHMAVRRIDDHGLVYATNHFVDPQMLDKCEPVGPGDSTWNRFERLGQLLEPGGADSLYGNLDIAAAISILRDTYDVVTNKTLDPNQATDGATLANNGCIQSVVFDPAVGILYVALGSVPAMRHEYVGYSIGQLLSDPQAMAPDPVFFP